MRLRERLFRPAGALIDRAHINFYLGKRGRDPLTKEEFARVRALGDRLYREELNHEERGYPIGGAYMPWYLNEAQVAAPGGGRWVTS